MPSLSLALFFFNHIEFQTMCWVPESWKLIQNSYDNMILNRQIFQTLSKSQYDWRKIEHVTMKANFIHFWSVESEFIVKNQFHNWTSELGTFLENLALFKHFSTGNNQLLQKTEPCWQWCWQLLEYQDMPKRAKK